MIQNPDQFNEYVGKIMMECQCIEHDVKFIFAGMLKGDFDKNYRLVANKPLGYVLKELQILDNCDDNPYLSPADYDLLQSIRHIRNYWAHKAYTSFVYKSGEEYLTEFSRQAARLDGDFSRLRRLSQSIEQVRLDVLRNYGRI